MKQLQITETNAMRLYNTASPEFKTALEDTFGRDFFHRDITERIKTYEDACELLGLDPDDMPDVSCVPEEDEKSHIAYHKLIIIARALNEGWRPNWKNTSEDKWFNWWYIDTNTAGFGSAFSAAPPRLRLRISAPAFASKQRSWLSMPQTSSNHFTKITFCLTNKLQIND